MATHSSVLAWRIPWTEDPGGLQPMGSKESDMTKWLSTHTMISLKVHQDWDKYMCWWLLEPKGLWSHNVAKIWIKRTLQVWSVNDVSPGLVFMLQRGHEPGGGGEGLITFLSLSDLQSTGAPLIILVPHWSYWPHTLRTYPSTFSHELLENRDIYYLSSFPQCLKQCMVPTDAQ